MYAVCIDTDFLIELARRKKDNNVVSNMAELVDRRRDVVHTTIINVSGYYAGIFGSTNKDMETVKVFIREFSILPLDE